MGEVRIKRDVSEWDNRPAHQYVNGEWIDIPTHHFINNRWQGELTSQSPLKFWADGEMLDYSVYGANGGVGDKTANLFDKDNVGIYPNSTLENVNMWLYDPERSGIVLKFPCDPNTQYTLSFDSAISTTFFRVALINSDDVPVSGQSGSIPVTTAIINGAVTQGAFTTFSDTKYILFQVASSVTSAVINALMLTLGSTASSTYIPYGYEVPMMTYSAVETTPTLYIGNISSGGSNMTDDTAIRTGYIATTESQKWLVKTDGTVFLEKIVFFTENAYNGTITLTDDLPTVYKFTVPSSTKNTKLVFRASNAAPYPTILSITPYTSSFKLAFVEDALSLYIGDSQLQPGEYTSCKDQKIYKHVNGVLTPTDPPVPIPALPTIQGNNTLSVDTAVKPSKMFVKFEG